MGAVFVGVFAGLHQAAFERNRGEAMAEARRVLPGAVVAEHLAGAQQVLPPGLFLSLAGIPEPATVAGCPGCLFDAQAPRRQRLLAEGVTPSRNETGVRS